MRIEEFHITHYGPLPDRGKISLGDFNLFYGVNETGKTLTLEALIKLLLGKQIKDFKNIDRVDEEVDGYVIVGTKGEQKKLGRKVHLYDIVSLTSAECRNIFIIRNSDLSIAPESSFYAEITNRLTGLETNRINLLGKKILEISALTPGGDFSDKKEDGHLKTRMEDAERLLEYIKSPKGEIEEERIEELERKWINLSDKLEEKETLKNKFEEARRRLTYERASSAINIINENKEKIKDLLVFSEENRNKWRDSEKEKERANRELSELKEALRKTREEVKIKDAELENRKNEFKIAKIKKEKIDRIRPLLTDVKEKFIEISSGSYLILAKPQYFIMVSIMLFLSILGLIIKESQLFGVLTLVFLFFFLVSVFLQCKNRWNRTLWEKNFSKLKLDLAEVGIKGEKIENLLSEVESFAFKFSQQEEDIKEKEVYIETLNNKKREIQEKRIPRFEDEIEKGNEAIGQIKSRSFINSLKEFDEKLNVKKELETVIGKEERVLKEILREEKIEELKVFKNKAKDVEFDEKEYEILSKEITLLKEDFDKIRGKFEMLSDKLKEMEKKVNKILPEENLRCDGSGEIENIEKKIRGFIEEKENLKEDATISMKILEEIANEEKTKIVEQFGQKSPVSKFFASMTKGLYTGVEFNEETEEIEVTLKDEVKLSPRQLSGGTYDQLYFSIRLALGEKLLGEEKGFFILDDPFIKASHDRLGVLMDMLKDICRSGWQVIYFSAKEEVREMLGKEKEVKFIELERIL